MATSTIFQQSYNKLNATQQMAVNAINGPVMVLAGPGTGKTEVLATRIGQILNEAAMLPANILCLTFSNAGVQSMQKRLATLLGPTGEAIEVHTYHSFANKIIHRQKGEDSFAENGLLTDVQQFMIFQKLLSNQAIAGKYFDLKPANTMRLRSLNRLFGLFKKEGITSDSLKEITDYTLELVLPFADEYLKKNKELNAVGQKMHQQISEFTAAIAPMYDEYLRILKALNKYEYDDLLEEAVKLLKADPALLADYLETYQYILVDEFQDTNRKQLDLLEMFIKGVEQPNLFIVGDDDQCVYKFQGANKENFNWMQQLLPDIKLISLDTNYRSSAAILKGAFAVINQNLERHALKSAALQAGIEGDLATNIPLITSYKNEEQEAFGIATAIFKMIQEGAGNIAVLFRKNKDSVSLKKWLHYYAIPFAINQTNENLLDSSFGKGIYYSLQFIRLYGKDGAAAVTYFTKLLMELGHTEALLHSFLLHKKESHRDVNYLDWIMSKPTDDRYIIVRARLTALIDLAAMADAALTDESKASIVAIACDGLPVSKNELSAWAAFVAEFELSDKIKSSTTLANLLWYYNIHQRKIAFEKEAAPSVGVVLSTIHSSKGLEYDTVFIKGCHNKNWEDAAAPKNGINVPKLLNQFIKQDSDEMEDIRRVFYVALTRAKAALHISYCEDDALKNPLKASVLLAPLFDNEHAKLETVAEVDLPKVLADTAPIKTHVALQSLIKERMNSISLSTSSVGSWVSCQNKFFFLNICKLSDEGSEAMSFGSLLHEVLEAIGKDISIQRSKERIDRLVDATFHKFQYAFHPMHQYGYRHAAKAILGNYLAENPLLRKPDQIESFLKYTLPTGVKLNGKIDRLEFRGDTIAIIDYKSGKYYPNNEVFQNEEEMGSGYWRQGMMYHYLIRCIYGNKYQIDFAFHYVEEQLEKNRVIHFEYEENKAFEEWLLKIWQQIHECRFNKKCDNDTCPYCKARLDLG